MKFRRILTPAVLIITLLVQFLPGTVFAPRPVAAAACDAAQFMGDITIPDGTHFAPGAALSKTWQFKNIGTCIWNTSYAIVFYSGAKMGAPSVVYMPNSVNPGATVNVTVPMTAPTTSGQYRGYWMLRNDSGVLFGVGPYGTYWFFIDIVVEAGSITPGYDFVAHCTDATWTSGAGHLDCPVADGSPSGYVFKSTAPQLEDGTLAAMPGLIVAPNNVTDGYIFGTYPAILVQSGDRFQSIVSCQYGVSSCYVTFRLDYQIDDGTMYNFWTFREKTEGLYYRANLSLSSLAGHNVKFTLKVLASGSPAGDRVVWGGAQIVHAVSAPPVVPTSTPTPGPSPTATTIPPTATAVIVGPSADMSVTINDGLSTYAIGGTTTYTVVVSNGGPSPITDAIVTIPKPAKILSWTATCVAEPLADCTAVPPSSGTISDLVDLPVGKKVTYTIIASISGGAVGNLVTTATVTNPLAIPDPNITNNSATDTDAPPSADLSISITDGMSTWTPGSSTDYMVVVINNGPLSVTGAVFDDIRPDKVTEWSWTCTPDTLATCGVGSGGLVTSNIHDTAVNIPAGKKVTYWIHAHLTTVIPGNLVNNVSIAAPGGMPDPVPENNSATDTDTGPNADLAVVINTDNVTYYTPFGTLHYTIRVFNNGPYAVTGATFTDNKPDKIFLWTWTCVHDTNSTCTASPVPDGVTGNVTDTINLPVGEGVTYTVSADVAPSPLTGSLVNTALVTSPVLVPDLVPGNNSLDDTDFHQRADLMLSMTDGQDYYTLSGTVTYIITVTNSGPSNVTGPGGVIFSDAMPTQVLSWSWSCAPSGGATCIVGTSTAAPINDAVTIPVGGSLVYTVTALIQPATTGLLVNTAIINDPPDVLFPDPTLSNNTAVDNNTLFTP